MKAFIGLFVLASITGCGSIADIYDAQSKNGEKQSAGTKMANNAADLNVALNLDAIPTDIYNLSEEQKNDLLYMYEEEKLAHDLYVEFNAKWDVRIYENLAKAETHHLGAIKILLDKYQIALPENAANAGEFQSIELKDIYTKYLAQGQLSENDARSAAKTIEEKDIADLKKLLGTSTEDVKYVFERLELASEKHLQSLTGKGGSEMGMNGKGSGKKGSGKKAGTMGNSSKVFK